MTLYFWFDFASTYSYPAAMRIEKLAAGRGVSVVWRPFLLGPIFAARGWKDSPFSLQPEKGRYMWRDLERLCQAQSAESKAKLREQGEEAAMQGIFGAPFFMAGGEPFWGNDRLEQAISWCVEHPR